MLTTMSANIERYGNKCEVGIMKQWKQGIIRRDVQSRINMERELNDGEKEGRGVLSPEQSLQLLTHQVSC